MRRAVALIGVFVSVAGLLSGCDDDGWNPEAQFAPSLRPAFGARVTEGKLMIWTGAPCEQITQVALNFDSGTTELVLTAPENDPIELEYLTFGGPYPGLEVSEPPPMDFDWHTAKRLELLVYPNAWGSSSDVAEVVKGSAEHPADTYWFQGVGWLNAAQVTEQNASTFLTPCTADPAKS